MVDGMNADREKEVGTRWRRRNMMSTRLIVRRTEDGGDGPAEAVVHTVISDQHTLALDDRDGEPRRLERRVELFCEVGEYGA